MGLEVEELAKTSQHARQMWQVPDISLSYDRVSSSKGGAGGEGGYEFRGRTCLWCACANAYGQECLSGLHSRLYLAVRFPSVLGWALYRVRTDKTMYML